MGDKFSYTNRLQHEKSPYLLQHAHNPVDWYSWGDEAFQAARNADKPIFLSIGYATCHWCHVMEKESFEDPNVAKIMNDTFINIKVDREELPEVDSLYMEFAQGLMAGAAGWPLNVILTPDLQPFFAATYLPPHNAHGLMGLTELVQRIGDVWKKDGEERESLIAQADKIVEVFATHIHTRGEILPEKEIIEETADLLFKMADPVYGGIKGAPKFPIGYQMNFALRCSTSTKDSRAFFLVERTLDMMHRGGIYDHLGGGFSRYSVDEKWLVPHFEKMLYDNALLAYSYLEAWQVSKKPLYRKVCEEICNYVLRDMTQSEGGFFSAEDADSEELEGKFYIWEVQEIYNILGDTYAPLFCEFYGVTALGNFEGKNILHTKENLEEFATRKRLDLHAFEEMLEEKKSLLWKVREMRIHPLKDDKILTAWNGLMLAVLVEASSAFTDKRYLAAALKGAGFIKNHLWKNGHLLRRWRDGQALHAGNLDDYAFMIRAALSLFEADCGTEWLHWAIEMTNVLKAENKEDDGAFYQTDGADESIILRKCSYADGAEPSGNAIHCENLLRLYQITHEELYLKDAEDILKAVKEYLDRYSPGYCYHLINLMRYYDKRAPTIVMALNEDNQFRDALLLHINNSFIPHKAVIFRHEGDEELLQLIPYLNEQVPIKEQTTLYICFHGVCQQPIVGLPEMRAAIDKL